MSTITLIRPTIFAGFPQIFAAFTTRHFAEPSLLAVQAEAARLAEAEGFFGIAFTDQVHKTQIAVVDHAGIISGHDGLITRQPGLLISTFAADCALVLLADPDAGILGTCHAGWRGAIDGIVTATVAGMQELGASPESMLTFVSPCISVHAFEVGEDVAERFGEKFTVRRPEWPRPHVDLRGFIRNELRISGVPPRHIETSESCTVAEPDLFYSYRGQQATPGRQLALIGLREDDKEVL